MTALSGALRSSRLRHRAAVALLGTVPGVADALVGVSLQGARPARAFLPQHRSRSPRTQHHASPPDAPLPALASHVACLPAAYNMGFAADPLLQLLHTAGVLRTARAACARTADRRLAR